MRKLKKYTPTKFMAKTSHYDKEAADFAVMFIESLCHTKGTWAGKPFELIDWQEKIIRDLFGVVKENGYRQFNTAYIEIPKKQGKSELAAAVALLLTCGDGEERAEVYGCAADRNQAKIVFDVAVDMVRFCPALSKRVKILESQKKLVYKPTNSSYQVLSADVANKHGFNTHGVIFDELHTQPNRKLFDVMLQGSGDARMQPLYFLITTAGNDTNSICYEVHQKALDIQAGRKIDPTFYSVIYGASEDEDWTDPKVWKKAKTVYDTLSEKYVSITLGAAKANLISTVAQAEQAAHAAAAKVDRFPAIMSAAIQNATSLITGQSGGYVVINTDEVTGQPYELLVMDAPDIGSTVNIWRWNVSGLGFSHNGYNGPFETAITSDGQIVADFITTGTLAANLIKAGVLSSQDGSSWWDLETGEIHLRAYATTESVIETNERIDEIEEQKMYRLVITSSNGNIFKNNNIRTTLSAVVFSWDTNVTDSLDPNQFIWTRVSDDAAADATWNAAHFGGTKTIEITRDDVNVRATFFCDLIDTTTRNSLLG